MHLGHKGGTGWHIDVQVQGITISMLVDTRSVVSILSSASYEKLRSSIPLQSSTATLVDFLYRYIPVQGCIRASVALNSRQAILLFYVVPEGTNILCIDAVVALQLQTKVGLYTAFTIVKGLWTPS